MATNNFKVEGMTCEACVRLVTKRLMKIPGVEKVKIEYASGGVEVTSAGAIDLGLIKESLADTTYHIVQ